MGDYGRIATYSIYPHTILEIKHVFLILFLKLCDIREVIRISQTFLISLEGKGIEIHPRWMVCEQ